MSLIVTLGLGPAGSAGSAFSLSSVAPSATFIDLVFSAAITQITGPAAAASQYTIAPTGAGSPITILSASIVGGGVRLTTTEFTNGAQYKVTLPWAGFSDGANDPFQGPFEALFNGVGNSPSVVMARTVDARLMEVIYSEPVLEAEALNAANYAINNGLVVVSVAKISDVIYRLTTSRQVRDQAYAVTITNVHDQHGNLIS